MDRLRQFLAFPMYASAVWMVWVLTQQTGSDGVIYALGGMILIAFAIWLLQLGSGALGRAPGCAAAWRPSPCCWPSPRRSSSRTARRRPRRPRAGPRAGVNFEGWERFSRARMAEAVAAGKPVFVDFTAAWCITCLVNERVALTRRPCRKALNRPES